MEKHIRFTARMPVSVAEWLKESGRQQERSMNRQMVSVLKQAKAKEEKENAAQ